MKAYEEFLGEHGKWAAGVVGVLVMALLIALIPGRTPEEKAAAVAQNVLETEWLSQCEQISIGQSFYMERHNIGGQLFCFQVTLIEDYPIFDRNGWEAGCRALGGSSDVNDGARKCYMKEVVEELGAREDFGGTP